VNTGEFRQAPREGSEVAAASAVCGHIVCDCGLWDGTGLDGDGHSCWPVMRFAPVCPSHAQASHSSVDPYLSPCQPPCQAMETGHATSHGSEARAGLWPICETFAFGPHPNSPAGPARPGQWAAKAIPLGTGQRRRLDACWSEAHLWILWITTRFRSSRFAPLPDVESGATV
jgi:hypothetical protein